MKVVLATENLSAALKRVLPAISAKPSQPVMANFLINAEGDNFSISGCDYEAAITTNIPTMVLEPGQITIPAKKLQQIVSSLPSGDVEIYSEDTEVTLTCKKGIYKIHGLSADGYQLPATEDVIWGFNCTVAELMNSFNKVSYARSSDENRKELNGVLFSIRGGMMTAAATDGRRLALIEKPFVSEEDDNIEGDVILSAKSVSDMLKCFELADEKIRVDFTQSYAIFTGKSTKVINRLREGKYPNFRSVIPTSFAHTCAIPRLAFIDTLNRVTSIIGNSEEPSVVINIKGSELLITAQSAQYGEAQESLEISMDGTEINMCLNPSYILDSIKTLSCDQLLLKYNDVLNPISFQGDEGFIYILMPIKMDN